MVSKFGSGIGDNDTNQRIAGESTNMRIREFVDSHKICRFVSYSARGFTLLELLVSMAIFAIITTVVVVNFRTGRHTDTLRSSAMGLVNQMRELQSMAQVGRTVEVCPDDNGLAQVARGGYGLYIERGQILFFANCAHGNRGYNADSRALGILTPMIGQGVAIDSPAQLAILFEPPNASIFINGAQDQGEAQIILRHDISAERRTVIIRRLSGLIELL